MAKKHYRRKEYDLYRSDGNRRLCLIIHGLGGNKGKSYWADLAQLLRYDPKLANVDVCFWEFATSKRPLANLLALFRRGRRISTIPEVARSLDTVIKGLTAEYGYDEVALAGHSLGGAVALLAAEYGVETGQGSKITDVCFMATPQSPPGVAKVAARVARWNPHISWLASKDVNAVMNVSLRNMRLCGIHSTYVHYTLDELLPLAEEVEFDCRLDCEGEHGWPATVNNANTEAYRTLRDWIANPRAAPHD
ncbi:MAG TPA: alpha/beta fold hydrolase [Allosphingosinicella sp.]|jgi:pimeloyl-ACP methyl ester carboxylesterase